MGKVSLSTWRHIIMVPEVHTADSCFGLIGPVSAV